MGWLGQIQLKVFFPAVDGNEIGAGSAKRGLSTSGKFHHLSRMLDFNDLGAQVLQDLRSQRAGHKSCQIKDSYPGQRFFHHGAVPSCFSCSFGDVRRLISVSPIPRKSRRTGQVSSPG